VRFLCLSGPAPQPTTTHTMGSRSFPGVTQPGCGADHPPPSSAQVANGLELYLPVPSVPIQVCQCVTSIQQECLQPLPYSTFTWCLIKDKENFTFMSDLFLGVTHTPFPLVSQTTCCMDFSSLFSMLLFLTHPTLFHLTTLIIQDNQHKSCSSLCDFLYPIRFKQQPGHLILKHPTLLFRYRMTKFHTHIKQDVKLQLSHFIFIFIDA
jgi:hypothetical protein